MSPTKVQPAKRLKAPARELEIRLEVKEDIIQTKEGTGPNQGNHPAYLTVKRLNSKKSNGMTKFKKKAKGSFLSI